MSLIALFDRNLNRQRANTYATVLTPCARNGVFRYFDNWNSGAVGANLVRTGANPVRAVVDLAGNPATPADNPDGAPYTGQLRHFSVFGPVTFPASGPNTDCSNGTVTGSWDAFRTRPDPTGLISRTIGLMPAPNDFTNANNVLAGVDGLNIASYRYVRRFCGLDNLFSVGEATGDRYQYNGRIDHNFNGQNKIHFNFSYERVSSDDVVAGLPGTWNNENFHRPIVANSNWTSTISASIVNEARFGYRRTGRMSLPRGTAKSTRRPSISTFRQESMVFVSFLTRRSRNQTGLRCVSAACFQRSAVRRQLSGQQSASEQTL